MDRSEITIKNVSGSLDSIIETTKNNLSFNFSSGDITTLENGIEIKSEKTFHSLRCICNFEKSAKDIKVGLEIDYRQNESLIIYYILAFLVGLAIMFIGAIILPLMLYLYANAELKNERIRCRDNIISALRKSMPKGAKFSL